MNGAQSRSFAGAAVSA